MKTKHTNGKWEINIQSKFQKAIVCNEAAICFIPNQSENANENAKLIAAAPELLEALIKMTDVNNKYKTVHDFKDDELEVHRAAILAIKKATE